MAEQPVQVETTSSPAIRPDMWEFGGITLLDDDTRKSVLVVVAHPDDEAIGCGGTIARLVARGHSVHLVVMTDGSTGVRGYERERKARSGDEIVSEVDSIASSPGWRNAHRSARILGISSVTVYDFPDSRFETIPVLKFAQTIESHLDRVRPSIVITHYYNDLAQDHRQVANAVIIASRPKPNHPVQNLLFFEVASSTEWNIPSTFQPNLFINISAFQDKKEIALSEAYGHEMRDSKHPRSVSGIYALNSWRGSTVGVEVAEAFVIGRSIVR